MTVFSGACSVTSCRFNLGGGRVSCDWLRNGGGRCHHPTYREAWQAGHELEQAQEADPILAVAAMATQTLSQRIDEACKSREQAQESPARPSSLAARVAAASKPMSSERARQLILDLEGA